MIKQMKIPEVHEEEEEEKEKEKKKNRNEDEDKDQDEKNRQRALEVAALYSSAQSIPISQVTLSRDLMATPGAGQRPLTQGTICSVNSDHVNQRPNSMTMEKVQQNSEQNDDEEEEEEGYYGNEEEEEEEIEDHYDVETNNHWDSSVCSKGRLFDEILKQQIKVKKEKRKRRGKRNKNDNQQLHERPKDIVDVQILEAKGKLPAWCEKAFVKKEEKTQVAANIWKFEQYLGIKKSQFESLTKSQILSIIENMPLRLATLFRETEYQKQPVPQNLSSMKKSDLVNLMELIHKLYGIYDAKQRQLAEERLAENTFYDSDEEAKRQQAEAEERKLEREREEQRRLAAKAKRDIHTNHRIVFRTKNLSVNTQVITPRQAHIVNTVFFGKRNCGF